MKPLLVEEWLSELNLAPKSKGHIRSIMHIPFNWAMKWELIDLDKMNPMKLVRVEGSSKRLRQPRTLTVKEFRLLLERLEEPIRTMCIVAACLGLRASEVAGLQWGDFDWGNRQIHIQRGFVIGHVDEVKTTNSNRSLPVHKALATLLLEYKKETAPDAKDTDWLFQARTELEGHDGRGRSSELTYFPRELMPDWAGLAGTRFGILTRPCCAPCEWI